jgi:hypothetical protein
MARPATATRPAPRTAPLHPRRVSGPVRRPVPVGPPARGRTGPFERLARIPDNRIVDRLLRSRLCIWVIGLMLGGIVFMQVSLLRMNTGISRAVQTQETLVLKNSSLQAQIAKYTAGDRVREAALAQNMIEAHAGDTRYLTARESDVSRALKRTRPPSERALKVVDNDGMLPPAFAAPATLTGVAAATQVANPAATQQPVATPTALPTPGATPVPTVTPVATTPPVITPAPTVAPVG